MMQDNSILTNEEILEYVNHYHTDKEATRQRTAIQNANPDRWKEYLALQTIENQNLLIETKKYLDSLVSEKWKVLKYLEINEASQPVIIRITKLLNYDVEVAFLVVESAHQRAILNSGAEELVISLSGFYEKRIGIRPRIEAFLGYLADTMPIVYNLNSDRLRKPLAEYVREEERINMEYLGIYDDNPKPREQKPVTPPQLDVAEEIRLSHREISLLFYYDDLLLTDATAQEIAKKYGQNSGATLMKMYRKIKNHATERLNSRDSRTCLERVLPLLKTANGIFKANQDLQNVNK